MLDVFRVVFRVLFLQAEKKLAGIHEAIELAKRELPKLERATATIAEEKKSEEGTLDDIYTAVKVLFFFQSLRNPEYERRIACFLCHNGLLFVLKICR